jgi:glycosyltransferase involved in cell wall biosynthesis
MLSTFPPTACGLATFTAALANALVTTGAAVGVVRVADGAPVVDPRIIGELDSGRPGSVAAASRKLGRCDLAIVQHEYGLYGGRDGDEVVDILRGLTVPSIVVAHTVLQHPTVHQRSVLEAVADAAGAVVVMTEAARQRLCRRFDVDESKVATIPHGAAVPVPRRAARSRASARPLLLTWGLLGRGKGIEWVIDAMTQLKDIEPRPRYVVAGRTHPKVVAFEGEAYRDMLVERAWTNRVTTAVTFDAAYRDVRSLTHLIQDAAVVVLPYDSHDQVTSGVLVDAVAAGRPVVSTAFPHAVELLSSGAGIVVPHRDPTALATALRRILTEPGLAAAMAAEARRLAPSLGWPAIAARYASLADRMLARRGAAVG